MEFENHWKMEVGKSLENGSWKIAQFSPKITKLFPVVLKI